MIDNHFTFIQTRNSYSYLLNKIKYSLCGKVGRGKREVT